MNLKTILCHLFAIYHVIENCDAYAEILKLNADKTDMHCTLPFKEIRDTSQVIYFFADNILHLFLEYCLLSKRRKDQAINVMGLNFLYVIPTNEDYKYSNDYPDIVIIMPELSYDLYNATIQQFVIAPKMVTTYFIITTENAEFSCNNGEFGEDVFKYIDEYLNYLWHRYELINVILEFPMTCPGYYIIFKGKRPSGLRLYDRTIVTVSANSSMEIRERLNRSRHRLTRGYPLRANIFKRFPTSVSTCTNLHYYLNMDLKTTMGLCGMDINVMYDILNYFKFNVDFPELDERDGYGDTDTTTATGSMGHLLNDTIDISFNSRFLVWYLIRDGINILGYVGADSLCAVMKNPEEIPVWQYAYRAFTPEAWACLIVHLGLLGLVTKLSNKFRRKLLRGKSEIPYPAFGFIMLGLLGFNGNKKVKISILGGTCLLISIITLSIYQGNVNYVFTNLLTYKSFSTLAELKEMNIQIYTSPRTKKILGDVDTSQFVVKPYNRSDLITFSNRAAIQRKSDMELEIIQNFTDKIGQPQLYLIKECYANYFLSYIARKDFPFYTEISAYLLTLLESGLPTAYYRKTQLSMDLSPVKLVTTHSKSRPCTASTMGEQRVPFYLLLMGYLVSTLILVVEIWTAKRTKTQSNFDH